MISLYPQRWAIDFHVHTSFSKDCATPPSRVIQIAQNRGLAGIAITDHDTEEGGLAAVEANRDPDFLVIPGVEVKTDRGDLIGLFIKHSIKSRRFEAVLEEIEAQNGFSFVPHPLRTFKHQGFCKIVQEFPSINAWEIVNGRYELVVLSESIRIFQELNLPNCLSGSDAHMPWEIGACRTNLSTRPDDAEKLRYALSTAVQVHTKRNDALISAGIALGAAIQAAKARRYGSLTRRLLTLPIKGSRYALRHLAGSRPYSLTKVSGSEDKHQ